MNPFTFAPVAELSYCGRYLIDERRTTLREAAYIRRTDLFFGDAKHEFAADGQDIAFLRTLHPPGAPDWVKKPYLRWGLADVAAVATGARGSQPGQIRAWHIIGDLPVALDVGTWLNDVMTMLQLALPESVVADVAGHVQEGTLPHAHVLVAYRQIEGGRYGQPVPGLEAAISRSLRDLWLHWLGNETELARQLGSTRE